MSEVRGSSLKCWAATAQGRPRGASLCPRSVAAAGRNYPASEVRGGGQEELPHVRGQWQLGGDTPCPKSGLQPGGATPWPRPVAARRRHPASEIRARQEKPPRTRGQGR